MVALPEQRPLTERERAVALWMIAHAHEFERSPSPAERELWAVRLEGASACGVCGCGTCESVELAAGGTSIDTDATRHRVILQAGTRDGTAGVLLFLDDDAPSYLEVFPTDGVGFAAMPEAGELVAHELEGPEGEG